MRRKEWMRVVAALAAFAVLGTGSAVTAAAEETGTVVSETDSTADRMPSAAPASCFSAPKR